MKSLVLKRSMITYLLFILIGCQSLPVISIGGSTFKIYELLGLILLMQGIKCRRMLFLQCCFFYFIIAPCLSLLWGWLVLGYHIRINQRLSFNQNAHLVNAAYTAQRVHNCKCRKHIVCSVCRIKLL